jgi:hypothetical protein
MATRAYKLEIKDSGTSIWTIYQNDDGTWEMVTVPLSAKVGDLDALKDLFIRGISSMGTYGHTKIVLDKV